MPDELDPRDEYLARVVSGKSFCDVGGLWGTVSEKVSVAHAAGATRVTMLDVSVEESELWQAFGDRMASLGIGEVECISGDVTGVAPARSFDVVHCSGVIYHAPDPLNLLASLRALTIEHLVLASMVMPRKIRGARGSITFTPGQALFVPHLDERSRRTVDRYFRARGISGVGGIDQPVNEWSPSDWGPWWWLLTADVVSRMLRAAGFEVVAESPYWGGRAHAWLARCA